MEGQSVYSGKVLVAGATGRTGQWVVKRLLHYGIDVRVFSRQGDKAQALFGQSVEIVTGKIQSSIDVARAGVATLDVTKGDYRAQNRRVATVPDNAVGQRRAGIVVIHPATA